MADSINIQVDDRRFQEALQKLIKLSSRDMASVMTGKGMDLALESIRTTAKADADKLAWKLGQIGTRAFTGKAGRGKGFRRLKRAKRIYGQDTLAERIIRKRAIDSGEGELSQEEASKRARKFAGERLRAVGFVKSGWISAYLGLQKTLRDKRDSTGNKGLLRSVRRFGKAKGRAVPAKFGSRKPYVEIINSATLGYKNSNRSTPYAVKVAVEGLRKAAPKVIASMEARIASKLRERAKGLGFK